MTDLISRDARTDGTASDFMSEIKNGSAEMGDYPYVYSVVLNGDEYIGFDTGLPESREPWSAGYQSFTRDAVFGVGDDGSIALIEGDAKAAVNHIIRAFADDVHSAETVADLVEGNTALDPVLFTDGGQDCDGSCGGSSDDGESDDSESLGDLFG